MSHFHDELNRLVDEYSDLLRKSEASLKEAPEGVLRLAQKKKRVDMYVTYPGEEEHFLRKESIEVARKLAQKSYDQKVQALAKQRLDDLQKVMTIMRRYSDDEVMRIYQKLHPARRKLVTPIILPDEEFVNYWYSQGDKEANSFEIDGEIYSERGEHVRSKTEKIIADKLYMMGIPYKYESTLKFEGESPIYPDFTVLNVRNRKTFFWEHNGRMDDLNYCEKEVVKRNRYIKHGIWPGESLIITEETGKCPLSNRILELTIKKYLL